MKRRNRTSGLRAAFPAFFLFILPLASEPQVSSSLDYRVTNRRFIQHILVDSRHGPRLTIITTHPGPWAFKSVPHALHYQCADLRECTLLFDEVDQKLRAGVNLGLRLNGSFIQEIKFFPD
ncbi:MAG: hypothetical protein JNM27_16315 [Leptospirales bacterium]|nr:hypothetical protein [Leptospirales bacterium]